MFMTFALCDNNGVATGTKMCINMKTVHNITQMGRWDRPARQIDDIAGGFINEDEVPRRRTGAVRRDREPDTFIVLPQCANLNVQHGDNYQVIANFDELSKILESLGSMFEGT